MTRDYVRLNQERDRGAYASWLSDRAVSERGRPLRPSTVDAHLSRLRTAEIRCNTLPGSPSLLDVLQSQDQVNALVTLLRDQLSPGSVRNVAQVLRDYGAYAVATGLAGAVVDVTTPRMRHTRRTRFYSREDLEWLVLAAEEAGPRWHLFALSLIDTGMRVGEALGLEWPMLRLAARPPVYALPTTKTIPRLVVLTPRLCNVWQAPDTAPRLKDGSRHERDRNGARRRRRYMRDPEMYPFPFGYDAVRDIWPKLCSDAGIENLGIHAVRHSFASNLLADGVDLYPVSVLLGHASVSTAAEYYSHVQATSYGHLLGWER